MGKFTRDDELDDVEDELKEYIKLRVRELCSPCAYEIERELYHMLEVVIEMLDDED